MFKLDSSKTHASYEVGGYKLIGVQVRNFSHKLKSSLIGYFHVALSTAAFAYQPPRVTYQRLSVSPHEFHLEKIHLIVHVHYVELAHLVIPDYWSSFGEMTVFVTSERRKSQLLKSNFLLEDKIKVIENRGRNFAGFLQTAALEDGPPYILHLHTKLSPQIADGGRKWLDSIRLSLISSPEKLSGLISNMQNNSRVKLCFPITGPGASIFSRGWGQNFGHFSKIQHTSMKNMKFKGFYFPAGGMFLARRDYLLNVLKLFKDNFEVPAEPIGIDGSTLHFLERLIGAFCASNNDCQILIGYRGRTAQIADYSNKRVY